MEKKIFCVVVLMLLVATAVLPVVNSLNATTISNLGEVLDQNSDWSDGCRDIIGFAWQEFIPTMMRHTRVEVKIKQTDDSSDDLKLTIEKPLDNILTSKEMPASAIPSGTCDWVSFDFPDINLVPGSNYYIKLTAPSGSQYDWGFSSNGLYPPGTSSIWPADWCFRTYANEVVYYDVDLEIKKGVGMGVNVEIINNGDEPITEQLNCTFGIAATLMISGDERVKLTPQPIPPSGKIMINSGFVFGFGLTDISVSLLLPYPPYNIIAEDTASGFTFGPIVWVKG